MKKWSSRLKLIKNAGLLYIYKTLLLFCCLKFKYSRLENKNNPMNGSLFVYFYNKK